MRLLLGGRNFASISEFLHRNCISGPEIIHNAPPAVLYEHAVRSDPGTVLLNTGALCTRSGIKTGRSPSDKRVVKEPEFENDVDWGDVNRPLSNESFSAVKHIATSHLSSLPKLFVVDGYAGWDPRGRKKVRVICERPYHALFMNIMMIRPSPEELENFGEPDFTIFNSGTRCADPTLPGLATGTCVGLSFKRKEMTILGTEYAGEMKKGVFTYMMYTTMKEGDLPLHASMNKAKDGSTTLFFGLSGTGKTTLSADVNRALIGDDEHVWTSDRGCYNIEGGCYAKCVNLSPEKEPEIWNAIRFGSIVENVIHDEHRVADFTNVSLTENTRCAYPLEHIPGAQIPAVGDHPTNIIFLTCDAFGVLPPVSKLTPEQASYHFISGYTAKVAGTEIGVTEPKVTFSACYGGPFLVMHPMRYAERLAERLRTHQAKAWLINTGWTGGKYGVGKRISLAHTRAIIDQIHSGELSRLGKFEVLPKFGLEHCVEAPGLPASVLSPRVAWNNDAQYNATLDDLAAKFAKNFSKYAARVTDEVKAAGPN